MRTNSIVSVGILLMSLLSGCGTLNNPDMCRYIHGPASITIQGAGGMGGTIMATVDDQGRYVSIPRDPTEGCPNMPTTRTW